MAKRYHFESGGSRVLSTADGSFDITGMDPGNERGNCFIQFYSDAAGTVPVTPTAGTVEFRAGAIDDQFLEPPEASSITATTVKAFSADGVSTYDPPSFDSIVINTKLTFAGITGAPYARAFHWRS